MKKSRRKLIEMTIRDLVSDFMDYDRREDEDLCTDSIEKAVDNKEITVDEMVKVFKNELEKYFDQ